MSLNDRFTRWMYKGGRPNALARFMNWSSTVTNSLGLTSRWMVNLEVTGRTSGKTVSLPLVMVKMNGERYLVSMLGGDVQWIKNLRAAMLAEGFSNIGVDAEAGALTTTQETSGSGRPQTLRGWACAETFDAGLRPVRINGRLAWPVAGIRAALGVAV